MQNLKIRVNSADESKEAQELFFKLGFQWRGLKSPFDLFYPTSMDNYYIVLTKGSKEMQIAGAFRDGLRAWKEITLPKLRAMANQDQDEPFLTPECTLNDQYAEIEQVRQHKKHERNSSAWDIQIGGDHYKQFQIQPMQFALENKLDAAQQNVIKYIMRHSFKNGKQDLEKAKHYIDLMIEFYYGENNNG